MSSRIHPARSSDSFEEPPMNDSDDDRDEPMMDHGDDSDDDEEPPMAPLTPASKPAASPVAAKSSEGRRFSHNPYAPVSQPGSAAGSYSSPIAIGAGGHQPPAVSSVHVGSAPGSAPGSYARNQASSALGTPLSPNGIRDASKLPKGSPNLPAAAKKAVGPGSASATGSMNGSAASSAAARPKPSLGATIDDGGRMGAAMGSAPPKPSFMSRSSKPTSIANSTANSSANTPRGGNTPSASSADDEAKRREALLKGLAGGVSEQQQVGSANNTAPLPGYQSVAGVRGAGPAASPPAAPVVLTQPIPVTGAMHQPGIEPKASPGRSINELFAAASPPTRAGGVGSVGSNSGVGSAAGGKFSGYSGLSPERRSSMAS